MGFFDVFIIAVTVIRNIHIIYKYRWNLAAMTLACCTAGFCMSPALDNGEPVPQNAPFVIYTDEHGQVFTLIWFYLFAVRPPPPPLAVIIADLSRRPRFVLRDAHTQVQPASIIKEKYERGQCTIFHLEHGLLVSTNFRPTLLLPAFGGNIFDSPRSPPPPCE